jgi:hypothetical protein
MLMALKKKSVLSQFCKKNIFPVFSLGHLDRVVHGQTAEEILSACDENTVTVSVGDNVGANPALHFFRGLRHRNLAAIKLAATTGINQLHAKSGVVDQVRKKKKRFILTSTETSKWMKP